MVQANNQQLGDYFFLKKYVCIREEELGKILTGFELQEKGYVGGKEVTVYGSTEGRLVLEKYENGLTIIKTQKPIYNRGLVDVTSNAIYNIASIESGNVMVSNAVIEGTDGVGKTTTITSLVHQGIVCKDRSKVICRYMLFNVSMQDRCSAYKAYLEKETTDLIIFLVNSSREELEARIKGRGKVISEFDKMAYEYNCLYQETYEEMLKYQLSNPIELVDCTGLSLKEQVEKVKEVILRRRT